MASSKVTNLDCSSNNRSTPSPLAHYHTALTRVCPPDYPWFISECEGPNEGRRAWRGEWKRSVSVNHSLPWLLTFTWWWWHMRPSWPKRVTRIVTSVIQLIKIWLGLWWQWGESNDDELQHPCSGLVGDSPLSAFHSSSILLTWKSKLQNYDPCNVTNVKGHKNL